MAKLPPRIDFYHAADGRQLALRVWSGVDPPRARVVFLHGITSHGGWYDRSCQHLAAEGFEVHFLDRRGAGLNIDRPGDVEHWQTWVDDVATYLKQLGTERPVLLCGISWGGKLAAAVARQHPGLLRGLGLLSPGLYSPYGPGLIRRLLLAGPLPKRMQDRRAHIPLDRPELFTESPQWQEFIARDPLSLDEITVRAARADRGLTRFACPSAPLLHLPLLMMLAGRDRIVDNRRCRGFFGRVASREKTLLEYGNAAHTLEFEPDPEPYFADLTRWLAITAAE